jgi:hypothetical protein
VGPPWIVFTPSCPLSSWWCTAAFVCIIVALLQDSVDWSTGNCTCCLYTPPEIVYSSSLLLVLPQKYFLLCHTSGIMLQQMITQHGWDDDTT